MTTHAKPSGELMVIRYMEDFTDVVDHMTDQWENSKDKEAVFEFYTDSDDLKEKLLYLSTKQERGCFWDLYHCRGLEVEPIAEGDVFHVVIDNITSKQDPILQFRKTVEKLTEEWKQEDGYINCSFSTSGEHLNAKLKFLCLYNKQENVSWRLSCTHSKRGFNYLVDIETT